jgi:hypothetical protein
MYVTLYLGLIVAANLILTAILERGGSVWWSVLTAFLFIGGDFTLRDGLTDSWRGKGMVWKMGLLILAGSAISYVLNADSARIAVASAVAWGAAAVVDWVIYTLLRGERWMVRTTGSNIPSSTVDSFLFPTIAFGGVNWALTVAQFVAKVGGGIVWAAWLGRYRGTCRRCGRDSYLHEKDCRVAAAHEVAA